MFFMIMVGGGLSLEENIWQIARQFVAKFGQK